MLSENSPVVAIVAPAEIQCPAWLKQLHENITPALAKLAEQEKASELTRCQIGAMIIKASKCVAVEEAVKRINFPNGPKGAKKVGRPLSEYSYVASQLAEHFKLDKDTLERYARLQITEEEQPEGDASLSPRGPVKPLSPAKLGVQFGDEITAALKRFMVRELSNGGYAPVLRSKKDQFAFAKEVEQRVEDALEAMQLKNWSFSIVPDGKE